MTSETGLTVRIKVSFRTGARGRKRAVASDVPAEASITPGSVPRIARLMALAIRFEQLIRDGEIRDMAEIARLGHVTRARVTQIMNLLHLAPDIQEAILFLPRTHQGRDALTERDLRSVAALVDWRKQRTRWRQLTSQMDACGSDAASGSSQGHSPA